MYKVTIIGHYGRGFDYRDGQTTKTNSLTNELIAHFGMDSINTIDTHGRIKSLLKSPFHVKGALKNSQNVIMLPAHKGVKIYAPLMAYYKKKFSNHKIYYVVVGGWLPNLIKGNKTVRKALMRFDGIFVETRTMKKKIEEMGFNNVFILHNFKDRNALCIEESEIVYQHTEPYKLCTFSRVLKEKGIGDAVEVVNRINREQNKTVFNLDIYGPIDPTEKDWFEELKELFGDAIAYKGTVDSSNSTETLKNYYALLFPSHYYTEGIPGTIIDGYAAGLPVVSCKWESFEDVVDEGVTGLGYDFGLKDGLYYALSDLVKDPNKINLFRGNCLNKYKECFSAESSRVLIEALEG